MGNQHSESKEIPDTDQKEENVKKELEVIHANSIQVKKKKKISNKKKNSDITISLIQKKQII